MKKITRILTLLNLLFNPFLSIAQTTTSENVEASGEYQIGRNDANHPCITPGQYTVIEKQITENIKLLGLESVRQKNVMTTLFSWPLRMANGLNDCSYYYAGNYVDQDTTSPGIKDWNCGSVTYDGHMGTDFCTMPYPFYKMDNNQVEVIAAAPGTIIQKSDGYFDKNCVANVDTANYIIIQHADGSYAFYWHLKKNSLTAKTIGKTVVTGEYLGVVGSSGDATAPHLHFEVWTGNTHYTRIDPFAGTCNIFNANTWWANQKPYTEPAILKAQVNLIAPILPACPATETSNEDTCFNPGVSARMYIFIRNETTGLVAHMRIINPDGTTYTSWTHNSISNALASYSYQFKTLPSTAGTYIFEAVYNGDTCHTSFKINCGTVGIADINNPQLQVYPNPANSNITLQSLDKLGLITIYNSIGEIIYLHRTTLKEQQIDLSKQPNGIYFMNVKAENESYTRKLIIQK